MVKGERHHVRNNMAFSPGTCESRRPRAHLLVPHWIGTNPVPFNNDTEVVGNIADYSDGGKSRITRKRIPLSGSPVENNFPQPWDSCDEVQTHLVDVENRDFRPVANSPYAIAGAGPYTAGISQEYWIPGRQMMSASKPIPKNGANSIKKNRDSLIFLQGYNAESHLVYFSSEKSLVEDRSDEALLTRLEGPSNMAALPSLDGGKTYYWAVDATSATVEKGETWNFTTEK